MAGELEVLPYALHPPTTPGVDTGLANSIGLIGLFLASGANVMDDGGRPVLSPKPIPPPRDPYTASDVP
jgi:hypothetical protein